jgi:hypothetical protein
VVGQAALTLKCSFGICERLGSMSTQPVGEDVEAEIARWTHLWLYAASGVLENLDAAHWDDHAPASSAGKFDAFTLVFVDAVRNVYRGASRVLPKGHSALKEFDERLPEVKELRDRLEHFDEYVAGRGRNQNVRDRDGAIGLEIVGSSGGGPSGHTVEIRTREDGIERLFVVETTEILEGARTLVLKMLQSLGRDDDRHQRLCSVCRPTVLPQ